MTVLYIAIGLALLAAVVIVLVKKACHWWDCGAVRRAWKKREPDSNDYDFQSSDKLDEYDRFFTDTNAWVAEGEKDVRENGPDDC